MSGKYGGGMYGQGRNDYDLGIGYKGLDDDEDDSSSYDNYSPKPKGMKSAGIGFEKPQAMKPKGSVISKYDVNNPSYALGSIGLLNQGSKVSNPFSSNMNIGAGSTYGASKKADLYNIAIDSNIYKSDFKVPEKKTIAKKEEEEKKKVVSKKSNLDFLNQLDDELESKKSNSDESIHKSTKNEYEYDDDDDHSETNSKQKECQKSEKNSTKSDKSIEERKESSKPQPVQQITTSKNEESSENIEKEYKQSQHEEEEENEEDEIPINPAQEAFSVDAMEEYMKKQKNKFPSHVESNSKIVEEKDENESNIKNEINDDYGGFDYNVESIQNEMSLEYERRLSNASLQRKISSNLDVSHRKQNDESIKESSKIEGYHNPSESNDIDFSERFNKFIDTKTISPVKEEKTTINQKQTESIDFEDSAQKNQLNPTKKNEEIQEVKKQNNQVSKVNEQKIQLPIQQEVMQSSNTHTSNNNLESKHIETLIKAEIGKYLVDFKTLNSSSNQVIQSQQQLLKSTNGLDEIKKEFNQLSISNSQLFHEGLRFKKFDLRKLYKSPNISISVEGFPEFKGKATIPQLKLESSLEEERKRKDLLQYECNHLKELNKKLEIEVGKMQLLRIENLEISKNLESSENQLSKMNQDFDDLKNVYAHQIHLIEERIKNTADTSNKHEKDELEKKYQIQLVLEEAKVREMMVEVMHFKTKNTVLETENSKLRMNIEQNDQIAKLKNENYILHEKNNDLLKGKESIEIEMKKLKEINNAKISSGSIVNIGGSGSVNVNIPNDNEPSFVNQIIFPKEGIVQNIFEQLINEQESNARESLLKSYVKEIERLNEEISFLKTVPIGNVSRGNYMTSNQVNNKNKINPALKESIELQIKKLQTFLFEEQNKHLLQFIEKEFRRLQDPENEGEITFNHFVVILQNIKSPLLANEIVEIFNNFPRIQGNRIRYIEFLSALVAKNPSSFYMQSDPTYLNNLESKLLIATNRVKELEKFILVTASEKDEHLAKINELIMIKKTLEGKINELNGQVLNYFMYREEKNINHPDIIQMKEKMKHFESLNQVSKDELFKRLNDYENKIGDMKKEIENKENLIQEMIKIKGDYANLKAASLTKEASLLNEINALKDKLSRYKKNYHSLNMKTESISKENERILGSLKEKGLTPEKVLAFVNNIDCVKMMNSKLTDLEKKNDNREERYKQLCINANSSNLNKEIDIVTKHYEKEKCELIKIINQKNSEIEIIKKEFSEILIELERLKTSKLR